MLERSFNRTKKYDINQKILLSLADFQSRAIVFSTLKKGKSAEVLARELKLPLSSVYKKISDLEDIALIEMSNETKSPSGKTVRLYKSRISKVEIVLGSIEPSIRLHPN